MTPKICDAHKKACIGEAHIVYGWGSEKVAWYSTTWDMRIFKHELKKQHLWRTIALSKLDVYTTVGVRFWNGFEKFYTQHLKTGHRSRVQYLWCNLTVFACVDKEDI